MRSCPFCAEEIQDAAIVCKHCGRNLAEKAAAPSSRRAARSRAGILLVILLAVVAWVALRRESGREVIAAVVNAPINLRNEVENVPASSWKVVPLTLPYTGNLNVTLDVVSGNPLDVFVVSSDQLDVIKQGDWSQVRSYTDFNALKTKKFRRGAMLGQGTYYLVLRDTSLGILSSKASDVSISARLNP